MASSVPVGDIITDLPNQDKQYCKFVMFLTILQNEVFCFNKTLNTPEESLVDSRPWFKEEAKDSIWTISDIAISPKREDFVIYSTMSGVLHLISKPFIFICLFQIQTQLILQMRVLKKDPLSNKRSD